MKLPASPGRIACAGVAVVAGVLVGAGCGISVLAASVEHVRLPNVIYRPLSGTGLTSAMAIAYPTHHHSAAIDAFLAVADAVTPTLKNEGKRQPSTHRSKARIIQRRSPGQP